MTDALPNLQLLQASADPDNDSEFRILVDGKSIKYITIGAGIYDCDDMCFGPSLVSLLPPLPPGDWNTGRISRHAATGEAHFVTVSNEPLPGITTTWHATHIDHLELTMEDKLRSNVYLATCPRFSSAIVVKFARFPWEISQLETETAAYEWIEGQQIAPNFLGHLTEEGRVIGFVMSHIPNCRHASPEDLQQCSLVLSKLHKLGVKHGDTNKHNFLIHNGRATLIDFENASRPDSADELDEELGELMNELRDTSGRGGRVVQILGN